MSLIASFMASVEAEVAERREIMATLGHLRHHQASLQSSMALLLESFQIMDANIQAKLDQQANDIAQLAQSEKQLEGVVGTLRTSFADAVSSRDAAIANLDAMRAADEELRAQVDQLEGDKAQVLSTMDANNAKLEQTIASLNAIQAPPEAELGGNAGANPDPAGSAAVDVGASPTVGDGTPADPAAPALGDGTPVVADGTGPALGGGTPVAGAPDAPAATTATDVGTGTPVDPATGLPPAGTV